MPLEYTPWPVLQNVRYNTGNDTRTTVSRLIPSYQRSFDAISLYHHQVSGTLNLPSRGTFQFSVTLLLRYRSQDVFSFGSWCLPNSRGTSNPRYSGTIPDPLSIVYVTITLYGPTFQTSLTQNSWDPWKSPITPHFPHISGGIRFELCRVHSPLLTASLRFLFLSLLRCFNSGRSRSLLISNC